MTTASPVSPVADQVDEVDHLPGDRVAGGEVPAGQQLAEVEAVVGHPGSATSRRQPPSGRTLAEPGAEDGPVGGVVAVVVGAQAGRRASPSGSSSAGRSGSAWRWRSTAAEVTKPAASAARVAGLEAGRAARPSRRELARRRRPSRRGPTARRRRADGRRRAPAPATAPWPTTERGVGRCGRGRGCPGEPHALAELGQAQRRRASRSAARSAAGRRPSPSTTASSHVPSHGRVAARRLAACRSWRATSRPARPVAAVDRPRPRRPSTMRDSAVRAVPSAMPNSSAVRTSRGVGSQARVGAEQDRGEDRPGGRAGSLRIADICLKSVRYAAWRWCWSLARRWSRPRTCCPTSCPPTGSRPTACPCPEIRAELRRDRRPAQRRHRGRHLGPGPRHDRPRRVDRPPAGLRRRLPPDGPGLRPVRDPRPRGRPQAALHEQGVERPDRPLGRVLPGLRAARRLPPRPLRPPQGRVRARTSPT